MNPKNKAIWNTPQGASLLSAMFGRKTMDEQDRETLAILKAMDDSKVKQHELGAELDLDIGRIQRDIEDTLIRHELKELVFYGVCPPNGEMPKVTARFRLEAKK
jgi:hypothetical protein